MKTDSPPIDKLAGISMYATDSEGIGGSIKKSNEDFEVEELLSKSFLNHVSNVQDKHHVFPFFKIEKRGIDSAHALSQIQRKTGLVLKIVGLKDAKATTIQYATANNVISGRRQIIKDFGNNHLRVTLLGFSRRPIAKSFLIGNSFRIVISSPNKSKLKSVSSFVSEINKIGNYYGLQRFGSERLVTHLVGKAILLRHFDTAVELLLSHTSDYDTKYSKEIREKLKDIKSNPSLLKHIPKGMDIERNLAREILNGKDSITALRTVPITIRRLFVQAFQAYIFNKSLSKAIENEFALLVPEDGDLCFDTNKNDLELGKIRKYQRGVLTDEKTQGIPIIRLPGYSFQPGKNRFDNIVKEIMFDESINSKNFFIKEMQELSESGGFRQASYFCKDFYHFVREDNLVVEFSSPKGSYATTLLREMIKPPDPILAGF